MNLRRPATMDELNRRDLLAAATAGGLMLAAGSGSLAAGSEATLRQAVQARRSVRSYLDEAVHEEQLLDILWGAAGINRPDSGGRTTPSWFGSYAVDLLVVDSRGVRRFEPSSSSLSAVSADDIRSNASPQPFVQTAPTLLVYVANLERMHEASKEDQILAAHVDSAIMAQTVYLACAASGLGTCLVGGANKGELATLLGLGETQFVTYVQPVGYPKPLD